MWIDSNLQDRKILLTSPRSLPVSNRLAFLRKEMGEAWRNQESFKDTGQIIKASLRDTAQYSML